MCTSFSIGIREPTPRGYMYFRKSKDSKISNPESKRDSMIRYTVDRGTSFKVLKDSKNKELIEYAVSAFGFLLNTSENRGKGHSWEEFAAIILASYQPSPRIMAVVRALQKEGK